MQVILLKDVKNLGTKNSIVNVKDGYVMNFLIPQGLGVAATEARIKELETEKQNEEIKRNKATKNIDEIIKKISSRKIIIKKQVSDKGKLFAAVAVDEILAGIKKEFGVELNKKDIKIKEHIKAVGEYEIRLEVNNKDINIKIKVVKK